MTCASPVCRPIRTLIGPPASAPCASVAATTASRALGQTTTLASPLVAEACRRCAGGRGMLRKGRAPRSLLPARGLFLGLWLSGDVLARSLCTLLLFFRCH